MKIIATEENNTNQNEIDSIRLQLKLLNLTPQEIKLKLRQSENSKKIINENNAFLQDSSKAPERYKCTEPEIEPIIHKNLASSIASLFESKEMVCTFINKYEFRIRHEFRNEFTQHLEKDVVIASYSDIEKHVFQGSGMTAERSFDFNADKLVNGVKTYIPGYSFAETRNIVAKAVSRIGSTGTSKILVTSPSGKQGSWKDGTPSFYDLIPTPTSPQESSNISSLPINKAGRRENLAEASNDIIPVTSLWHMEYSKDLDSIRPILGLINSISFVCLNPKTLVKEAINDSARSNLKESTSDESKVNSTTKTMPK